MFSLKLHNTLGNIKEEFIPINKNNNPSVFDW